MKRFFFTFAPLAVSLAVPLAAQENDLGLVPAEPDEADIAAVEIAGARGSALYYYDQAAWHTTDAMREDLDKTRLASIRGWVVIREDGGLRVTYWTEEEGIRHGVYSALFIGNGVSERTVLEGEARRLTDQQLAMVAAQQAARLDKVFQCDGRTFNSVTLPPEREGGPILLYLLTAQADNDTVPAGGHFRFEIRDGRVVAQRGFTKGCLDLRKRDPETGQAPEFMMVSHLMDPQPTEIHVFTALASQVPLMVMTAENRRIWTITLEKGRPSIYLAGQLPEK